MTGRPRYRSHLMRRLVEDIQGLDHIFAELVDIAQEPAEHPEAPYREMPRRRD